VEYRVSVKGKDQYAVNAKKMLGYKDNRSLLQSVAVTIYAQKSGDPDRHIYGDECTYDKQASQVDCNRNVSVELEPGTIAHTQHLSYDATTGRISSDVETALDRTEEMTGHAGKMDYFVNEGLMKLSNNFVIDLLQGGGMRGGSGTFQYKEHWATVADGVELTSTNGRIYGRSGRADLLPGTYRAKKITVEGGAAAEATSFTVNSDWLEGDLSDAGSIEHVLGRGSVRAERKSATSGSSEPLSGILTGPEVEAWLENSTLKAVEARQGPTFSSDSAKLDAAETIRIEPSTQKAGSIKTAGKSVFDREGLRIEGQDFTIGVKDEEQAFNTSSRATLKSADLTTLGDVTAVRFDTKTKSLTFLHQTGNVTFTDDKGGRSGSSASLTVTNGGDRIELEGGKPQFKDTQGTLEATKIVFKRGEESLIGDGKVVMRTTEKDRKPVVVTAGHVEATGTRVDYTKSVQMLPGDGTKVETEHLTAFPKEKRFIADGKVKTTGEQVVTADHLEANDSGNAHYTGTVFITGAFPAPKSEQQKSDKKVSLELHARDLDVHSKDGDVETIIAREGVNLTQGVRKGHGDRLEYRVSTGDILLVGSRNAEAEVTEPDKFAKGCSIHLKPDGGKEVIACENSSATMSAPVKK
jgi:lipopolysaccharide export system protein LptA